MKKFFLFITTFFVLVFFIFAKSGNNTQIIKSGEWIYDAFDILNAESGETFFTQNQPMIVGELKLYLSKIDYDKLSSAGKKLYAKIENFLYSKDDFLPNEELRFFINLKVAPEFYIKPNNDISYSFDYCLQNRLLEIPVIFGFSDFITIQSDFFIGKNYSSMQSAQSFSNIPFNFDQIEFYFPRFAYGSTGKAFDNWGFSFHVGKEGLQFGNSKLGSIVYNKTFETDFYSDLSFYTERLKYSLRLGQLNNNTFLYFHELDVRPFKNFRFSMIEGSLLNSNFQLRYLNPFMLMHQFSSWTDNFSNTTKNENDYYGESHFCAYLAFTVEFTPFKNFRIYGLYAQNEILDLGGSKTDKSLSVPDSLGGQLGIEYNFLLPNDAYLRANLEAVYTSPYLYVKHSPQWSLFRSRTSPNMQGSVDSWIGSPFGPDCFAIQISSQYLPVLNWDVSIGYLFKIHGENNSKNLFKQYDEELGIYTYYPSVKYEIAEKNGNTQECINARDKGRNMWMSGIPEYTHSIIIKGNCSSFKYFDFYAQLIYSFIFNCNNVKNNFQNGIEFSIGGKYSIL